MAVECQPIQIGIVCFGQVIHKRQVCTAIISFRTVYNVLDAIPVSRERIKECMCTSCLFVENLIVNTNEIKKIYAYAAWAVHAISSDTSLIT